ncbi:MAG: NUDIX hydrolase [Crocinitomicaceae bacterium]|nr:NUDIX hydrolase [Crocinitomicaceae bacterium]
MKKQKFNIRVYGILINSKNEILISDECRFNRFFTKFPGGGLEWGEGIKDCVKREFMEELGIAIEVKKQFYCTDFFIASAFCETDQLISIYYLVDYPTVLEFPVYTIPFSEEKEQFRWVPLQELTEALFTFPIDKIVAKQLKEQFATN